MNGILIIDKPAGITSHDVVSRVRRILKTKRVGHTGTLDPFATGVLVILVGQATRLAQFLDKDEKEYEALVRFGFETDTGDVTGNPTTEEPKPMAVRISDMERVIPYFQGEIEQTPPMYSAKKIDGKKLYEHARRGETVERKAVLVNISKLVMFPPRPARPDERVGELSDYKFRVACSAGTYIRTLAVDIGRKIGVGAHLGELRRTRAGKFDLTLSTTLEQLSDSDDPALVLLPMEAAVSHIPSITITDDRVSKTRNGLSTRVFDTQFADGVAVQMVDSGGKLVAIGFFNAAANTVQPKVVLV